MASSYPIKKNTGTKIVFPIYDTTGGLLSGASTPQATYSLDGASYSSVAGTPTEIGTSGTYALTLLAAETNGDVLSIIVTNASPTGLPSVLVFYTSAQTLDEVATDVAAIPINPLLDTEDGASFTAIPDMASQTTLAAIPTNPILATENGSSFTAIPDMALDSTVSKEATLDEVLAILSHRMVVDVANSKMLLYNAAGTAVIKTWDLTDLVGDPIAIDRGVPTNRGVPY